MAKLIRIALVLIIAVAGTFTWWWHQGKETTDNAYVKADIIPLMPSVEGTVIEITAPANRRVEQGTVLLRLDPGVYEAKVDQARAELQRAQAELAHLSDRESEQQALITVAQAALEAAGADMQRSEQQVGRLEKLSGQQYVSQDDLDAARLAHTASSARQRQAAAELSARRAALATIHSEEPELQAEVSAAQAVVRNAELMLSYTHVIAPRAGTVTSSQIQLGQSVHTGERLLSIVTEPVWIYANYKETQIAEMQVGDPVDIEVDAYGDKVFKGHIDSFYAATGAEFALLPPQNATGNFTKVVQRLPVKILFEEGQDISGVRAGMSVVTTVYTSHD